MKKLLTTLCLILALMLVQHDTFAQPNQSLAFRTLWNNYINPTPAWAAEPNFVRVVRLGVVRAGEVDLGPMALDRFLILISAESDTAVRQWHGRAILRGESASNRLRPADNYQFFLPELNEAAQRRLEYARLLLQSPAHQNAKEWKKLAHELDEIEKILAKSMDLALLRAELTFVQGDKAKAESLLHETIKSRQKIIRDLGFIEL